ncbi:MAG: hypothetical protein AAF479_02795 [Pseudomonadota bacterium]
MQESAASSEQMFLAIGGGALKHWRCAPEFFLRSGACLRQARRMKDCLHAEVGPSDGLLLSYTAWRDAEAMQRFARSGAHRRAVQRMPALVAWFEFHHFTAETLPPFAEALSRWRRATGRGAGVQRVGVQVCSGSGKLRDIAIHSARQRP